MYKIHDYTINNKIENAVKYQQQLLQPLHYVKINRKLT